MPADIIAPSQRKKVRRELLRRYVCCQRELIESDPSSPSYAATIQAFRHLGQTLMTCGFDDDLDRLLRIRVLPGGRSEPSPRHHRLCPSDLQLIEQRAR